MKTPTHIRLFAVKDTGAMLALGWLILSAVAAVVAPYFLRFEPSQIGAGGMLDAPSWSHWMGTDQLGRDVLTRLCYGARVSLAVGLIAVGISTALGVLIGACAGYAGGKVDWLLMALTDIMLCFPVFFLILACIALLEPSLSHIMIIIGLTGWMGTARLVRAEVLTLKEREFVLAARALGASPLRVLFRHIVPNALGPVFVTAILGVASAVLIESSLSFLGIGVQPPTPSWGNILTDGKAALGYAWWLTVFPGFAILLTVLSYNLVGERLRGSTAGEDPR